MGKDKSKSGFCSFSLFFCPFPPETPDTQISVWSPYALIVIPDSKFNPHHKLNGESTKYQGIKRKLQKTLTITQITNCKSQQSYDMII